MIVTDAKSFGEAIRKRRKQLCYSGRQHYSVINTLKSRDFKSRGFLFLRKAKERKDCIENSG